jgi:hypothetical protein
VLPLLSFCDCCTVSLTKSKFPAPIHSNIFYENQINRAKPLMLELSNL